MHITIEQNKVVVNLDEFEFPKFEKMFANLEQSKLAYCDFREFPDISGVKYRELMPMHLCRTIGEANLSADPFATMTLYPFWKYGFAFGEGNMLALGLGIDDPHKKAVAADEFGMGFCCWAMEEIFDCEFWADCSTLIKSGAVFPIGTKRPDFVCGFKNGSLGIFEAKGTTGSVGDLTAALKSGKTQTSGIGATDPISQRVAVGCALGTDVTRVILLDPPPNDPTAKPTNLTADLVREAAKKMRTLRPSATSLVKGGTEIAPLIKGGQGGSAITIFRGPDGQIALAHDEYKDDKRHGWLKIEA